MMNCRLDCRSTRNSILPPLISPTALATSLVTVPVSGFGIRPRGPSTRPRRPTLPMRSGVATTASKSRRPLDTSSMSSSSPTMSAPAASAAAARSPVAKTRTRAVLPVPCGRFTVPRTIWSALRGSTPRRKATSTVPSNLVVVVSLARRTASSGAYSFSRSIWASAARRALLRLLTTAPVCFERSRGTGRAGPATSALYGGWGSALDRDAHGTRGTGDDLRGGVQVVGVEVGHLGGGDLADLRLGDLGDLGLVRLAGALPPARGLEDHPGGRRRLGDEGEGAVLVDRDLHRDHPATLRLGRGVVRLAELHDVDAVLTQRGADRRSRVGGAGLDLELDEPRDLLLLGRHSGSSPVSLSIFMVPEGNRTTLTGRVARLKTEQVRRSRERSPDLAGGLCRRRRQFFWIWSKESSTGVSRPKISTRPLTFFESGLISLMVACSVANGPSVTVTESPTSKSSTWTSTLRCGAGFPSASAASRAAFSSASGASILTISSSVSG